MTLTNKIQAQEHLNKQLNERLVQKESPTNGNVRIYCSFKDLNLFVCFCFRLKLNNQLKTNK